MSNLKRRNDIQSNFSFSFLTLSFIFCSLRLPIYSVSYKKSRVQCAWKYSKCNSVWFRCYFLWIKERISTYMQVTFSSVFQQEFNICKLSVWLWTSKNVNLGKLPFRPCTRWKFYSFSWCHREPLARTRRRIEKLSRHQTRNQGWEERGKCEVEGEEEEEEGGGRGGK